MLLGSRMAVGTGPWEVTSASFAMVRIRKLRPFRAGGSLNFSHTWSDGPCNRSNGEGERSVQCRWDSPTARRWDQLGLLFPTVGGPGPGTRDRRASQTREVPSARSHVRVFRLRLPGIPEHDRGPPVADGHPPDDGIVARGVRPRLHPRAVAPCDREIPGRDRRTRGPGVGHQPARRWTLVVGCRLRQRVGGAIGCRRSGCVREAWAATRALLSGRPGENASTSPAHDSLRNLQN
jgi:hypothetical protein